MMAVQLNPFKALNYQMIAVAAVVGVVVGFFIGRRFS